MNSFLDNIEGKGAIMKQKILGLCINDGDFSIAEFSKELNASIPTVTRLIGELIEDGFLEDLGKTGTSGGRRPSIYGLNQAAGYFVGTDIRRRHISIAITNFKGKLVDYKDDIPFTLEGTEESLKKLSDIIKENTAALGIPQDKVLAYGINLTGRVNHTTGYSFSYFIGEDKPLSQVLEKELNAPVFLENDSRAMAYGEYICGEANNEKNMLFINLSWGLGMGMIIEGKLSYGKSGFSGEIGHFPMLDNGKICHCGKIGCLETGASGSALHRIFVEKLKEGKVSALSAKFKNPEDIGLDDILEALMEEDMLAEERSWPRRRLPSSPRRSRTSPRPPHRIRPGRLPRPESPPFPSPPVWSAWWWPLPWACASAACCRASWTAVRPPLPGPRPPLRPSSPPRNSRRRPSSRPRPAFPPS